VRSKNQNYHFVQSHIDGNSQKAMKLHSESKELETSDKSAAFLELIASKRHSPPVNNKFYLLNAVFDLERNAQRLKLLKS